MESVTPVLYIVATPIGHLDDMTERAKKILTHADVIAAEDTRETHKLLNLLNIKGKRLVSYHDHGEEVKAQKLLDDLEKSGGSLALVSDAGTPCISDPGYRIVAEAHRRKIPVHPIPGPSALTALASCSGLPTNRIMFLGFLPTKLTAFQSECARWQSYDASVVFYESTRRLQTTLMRIAQMYPKSMVTIGREMTKLYEEIVSASIEDAVVWSQSHATLRGEVAVMVSLGRDMDPRAAIDSAHGSLRNEAKKGFQEGATLKTLLQKYKDCGITRSELYAILLAAKEDSEIKMD